MLLSNGWSWTAVIAILIATMTLSSCATVPLNLPKTESTAIDDTSSTYFSRAAESLDQLHDGQSGFFPFVNGMDALGASSTF